MLTGPDISFHNGAVNWRHVAAAGHAYGFCKATEGRDFADPSFQRNWAGLRDNFEVRGAYHFARPQPLRKGSTEAAWFLKTVGRVERGDLLVLDIEAGKWQTKKQYAEFVRSFVVTIEDKIGRKPIIYTGYWWRDTIDGTSNYGCPLWLAAYTASPERWVPRSWADWTFWQWTESGSCPGVSGSCDMNRYDDTVASLHKLAGLTVSGTKPTIPPSHPYPGKPIVRGNHGYKVKQIQFRLNTKGWKLPSDGTFGARTENAVKAFQTKERLSADGVVGENTWIRLFS